MFLSSPPRLHQISTFIAWCSVLRALCCLQGSRSRWWLMGMIGRPASFPTDRARLAWLSCGLRGCLCRFEGRLGGGVHSSSRLRRELRQCMALGCVVAVDHNGSSLIAWGVRSWRCCCDCYVAFTQWAAEEAVRGWVREGLVWRGSQGAQGLHTFQQQPGLLLWLQRDIAC